MTSTDTRVIAHWLDGKPFAGTSEDTATVTNPATGQITGRLALANLEDARAVIDAAAAASPPGVTPHWPGAHRYCSASANSSMLAKVNSPRSSQPSTARFSPTPSAKSAADKK